MRVAVAVIVAGCAVLTLAGIAWRRMPNPREFPSDGRHAPRPINDNRDRRR